MSVECLNSQFKKSESFSLPLKFSGTPCSYDISTSTTVGPLMLAGEPGYVINTVANPDTITTAAPDNNLDGRATYAATQLNGQALDFLFAEIPAQTATTTLSYSLLAGVDPNLETTDISVSIVAVSNPADCLVTTSPSILANAGDGTSIRIVTEFGAGTTCSYVITAPTTVGGLTLSAEPGTSDGTLDGTIRRTAAQLSGNSFSFVYNGAPATTSSTTFSYSLFEGTDTAHGTTDVTLNIAPSASSTGCTANPSTVVLPDAGATRAVEITSSLLVGGPACSYDISTSTTVGPLMLVGEPGYVINTATNPDTITTAAQDTNLDGRVTYTAAQLNGQAFDFLFGQVASQTATTTLSYSLLAGVDTNLRTTDIAVTITAVANPADCIVVTSPVILLNAGTGVTTTITTEFGGGTTCSYDIAAPRTVGGLTLSEEPGTSDGTLDGTIRRTAAQLADQSFDFVYNGAPETTSSATFSYSLFEGTNTAFSTTDITINIEASAGSEGCTATPSTVVLPDADFDSTVQFASSLTVAGTPCTYDISTSTTAGPLKLAGEFEYTLDTSTNPDTITNAAPDNNLDGRVTYTATQLDGQSFDFLFAQIPAQTATTILSYDLLDGVDISLSGTDVSITIVPVANPADCLVTTSPSVLANAGDGVSATITTEFAGGTTCSYDISVPRTVGGLTLSAEPGTSDGNLDGTIRRTAAQLAGNSFEFTYNGAPDTTSSTTLSYTLFDGTNTAHGTTDVTVNIAPSAGSAGCTATPTSVVLPDAGTTRTIELTSSLLVGGPACSYDISTNTIVGPLRLVGELEYELDTSTNPDTITTAAQDNNLNGRVTYTAAQLNGQSL